MKIVDKYISDLKNYSIFLSAAKSKERSVSPDYVF